MAEEILIIDDDSDTIKLIAMLLKRRGYEVLTAARGREGLEKARAEQPNLILLDVMMPDMDGYEVTRHLRSDPELRHIPIIMFTAKAQVADKVAGFEAGVDDYLTKPIHPAELDSRVKAHLLRVATSARVADAPTPTPTVPAVAAPVATPAPPPEPTRIIGFMGATDGLGTSTLVLNIALATAQAGKNTIVCDLQPGRGTLSLLAGINQVNGLGYLLGKSMDELDSAAVEGQLISRGSGLRFLLCAADPNESHLSAAAAQAERIVHLLSGLGKALVLDLGSELNDMTKRVAAMCDQVIVIVDPQRVALAMGKNLLTALKAAGIDQTRIEVVMINRLTRGIKAPQKQAEGILTHPILAFISPAPELAYQAAEKGAPMILFEPDSVTADEVRRLAQRAMLNGKHNGANGANGA